MCRLARNEIGDAGASALGAALKQNFALKHLLCVGVMQACLLASL